jgi:hypothetical protein
LSTVGWARADHVRSSLDHQTTADLHVRGHGPHRAPAFGP